MATSGYALVLSIMKKAETPRHYVRYSDLVELAEKEGLNPESIERYLERLKKIGTIYSPRPGVFRIAD